MVNSDEIFPSKWDSWFFRHIWLILPTSHHLNFLTLNFIEIWNIIEPVLNCTKGWITYQFSHVSCHNDANNMTTRPLFAPCYLHHSINQEFSKNVLVFKSKKKADYIFKKPIFKSTFNCLTVDFFSSSLVDFRRK